MRYIETGQQKVEQEQTAPKPTLQKQGS
jgi:hypothetical protein